ncbi:hypothetical protein TRAPUB_5535 [Trametes pubescens]|uniref:F-box domain-containing protein n=1 Tax=Trametes pubescens TaxID=154538 RepID=A0A1M2V8G6_TRAPU|nr:hypothetical protein TRAPUB_5535 [Trametes pubescens]
MYFTHLKLLSHILHVATRPTAATLTSTPMQPPQRVHRKMLVELWLLVFAHLQKKDLVSLGSTCKHVGAIAEASFIGRWTSAPRIILRLAGALSQPPNLTELVITGVELPQAAALNILANSASVGLRTFHCGSDPLVLASWPSLTQQHDIDDFRGIFAANEGGTGIQWMPVPPSLAGLGGRAE